MYSTEKPKKLLENSLIWLKKKFATSNYNLRMKQSYCGWIKRFILYHNKRHPAKMGRLR
jgi:hypothetical protein